MLTTSSNYTQWTPIFCFYLYQGTLPFRHTPNVDNTDHQTPDKISLPHKETQIQHPTQDKGITFTLLLYEEADSANYHNNQCH